MDISFLLNDEQNKDPANAESASILRSDPDRVGDYLILNSRSSNIISRYIAETYYARCIL